MEQIRHLRHHDIDRAAWDETVRRSPGGMTYAMGWYLDIVSPGWEALATPGYSMIMPLPWRKKFGIRYLYQPPFTQQLGLFSVDGKPGPEEVKAFVGAIPASFRYRDIFLNKGNVYQDDAGTKVFPRITHHLNLGRPYDDIRKGYSENLVRNLKKASAAELAFVEPDPRALISLFRQNRGSSIETLKQREYEILSRMLDTGIANGRVTMSGISDRGQLLAGAAFLESIHEYVFLFSASGAEGREKGAMSAIIDRFIGRHSNNKKVLDFEGSMDKNLSRYYKGYVAVEIVYLHIQQNKLPLPLRWMKS